MDSVEEELEQIREQERTMWLLEGGTEAQFDRLWRRRERKIRQRLVQQRKRAARLQAEYWWQE